MRLLYFTICARNYLAYALALRDSLRVVAPEASFAIFLSDDGLAADPAAAALAARAPGLADIVTPASALELADLDDMTFRYDVLEFSTSIKPFCFRHAFDKLGFEAAVYLDPDIFVLEPLDHVLRALVDGADAVLTPHFREPPPSDGKQPDAEAVIASGIYNLGFAAFANRPGARRFIDWWAEKCATNCFDDIENGLFVDQKFAEEAPRRIADTLILDHPGYNAAYWNLHERPICRRADGKWMAGGSLLRFFHFSGVVPGDRSVFSKHQTRFRPTTIGPARVLLDGYLDRLEENGAALWRDIPYAFGQFGDGVRIPRAARRDYARRRDAGASLAPFVPDYDRLNGRSPDVPRTIGSPISVFMHEVWRMRADLKAAFPLQTVEGRRGFHRWFLINAAKELGAPDVFIAPARAGPAAAGVDIAIKAYRRLPERLKRLVRGKMISNA